MYSCGGGWKEKGREGQNPFAEGLFCIEARPLFQTSRTRLENPEGVRGTLGVVCILSTIHYSCFAKGDML